MMCYHRDRDKPFGTMSKTLQLIFLIRTADREVNISLDQICLWNDTWYLQYNNLQQAGLSVSRDQVDAMVTSRPNLIRNFVVAECVKWDGTYLRQLENDLISLSLQKSWSVYQHMIQI